MLVLSLGEHPPANAFVLPEEVERGVDAAFPLDAWVCLGCALIQIPDRVPAEFYRHYLYTPDAAEGLRRHFDSVADELSRTTRGLVVDVGCNVGLLLDACRARGVRCVGVDPAENLAVDTRARGHDVLTRYFDRDAADEVRARFGPADVVITTNTFNHIDDLHAFVGAAAHLLADEGVFVVEVPHAGELIEQNQFDTIYQEHLSEFSVRSFVELFRATGLALVDVLALPVHGGSMRVVAQKLGGPRAASPRVGSWLDDERRRGLFERATYEAFAARVEANRAALVELLARLRAEGASVAAYGAPAKGNTLLIHAGLGPSEVAFIADRNVRKQGRLAPKTHIPVVPVERILEAQPDYMLLLAWNYADEVFRQQAEWVRRGGRFIVPIPAPRIVSPD